MLAPAAYMARAPFRPYTGCAKRRLISFSTRSAPRSKLARARRSSARCCQATAPAVAARPNSCAAAVIATAKRSPPLLLGVAWRAASEGKRLAAAMQRQYTVGPVSSASSPAPSSVLRNPASPSPSRGRLSVTATWASATVTTTSANRRSGSKWGFMSPDEVNPMPCSGNCSARPCAAQVAAGFVEVASMEAAHSA